VLHQLRSDDTNQAIETLEGQLDTQIIELGMLDKDMPVAKRDPAHLRLITRLHDYRGRV
jgi:hypothetical protein